MDPQDRSRGLPENTKRVRYPEDPGLMTFARTWIPKESLL